MENNHIMALCMVAVIASFLGFVTENIWLSITKGYMDNRNMCLPFLLGYGIGMLLIYVIFGTPDELRFLRKDLSSDKMGINYSLYFIGVMFCICIGEIFLGKFVEKTCHIYWWDYSKIPLHITRYTSIPTSILFSCAVTIFMGIFLEPLCSYFQGWNPETLKISVIEMLFLLTADFFYNAHQVYKTQKMHQRWRIDLTTCRIYKKIHI